MKARMLLLTTALCFAGTALSFAQGPQIGTWKFDEAKSKVPAGFARNSTVTYVTDGDHLKGTAIGTRRQWQATADRVDRQVRR